MIDLTRLRRGGTAARQEGIPAPLRHLHRAVLIRFLQTGVPPAVAWITDTAPGLGLGAMAVAGLDAADLVHVSNGVVSVAYPFSGTPTRRQVELDGFPSVYAMCAIDAPGIPLWLGETAGSPPPTRTMAPRSR